MKSEEEIIKKIKEIERNVYDFHKEGTEPYNCLLLGVKYLKWVLEDEAD